MCTATWLEEGDRRQIFFSRDELRSRQRALPPQVGLRNGVSYLAPVDADAGGTWIAVNQWGLVLGLLNRNARPGAPTPGGEPLSRGLLVSSLIDAVDGGSVAERLAAADLDRYRPFTLLIFDAASPPVSAAWDGLELSRESAVERPVSSSSLGAEGAASHRCLLWRQVEAGPIDGDRLLDFHRSHRPERGPFSPCMHRPDARTVSLSRLIVAPDRVSLAYADGPPCRAPLGPPLSLPRQRRTQSAVAAVDGR